MFCLVHFPLRQCSNSEQSSLSNKSHKSCVFTTVFCPSTDAEVSVVSGQMCFPLTFVFLKREVWEVFSCHDIAGSCQLLKQDPPQHLGRACLCVCEHVFGLCSCKISNIIVLYEPHGVGFGSHCFEWNVCQSSI